MAELLIARVITAASSVLHINDISKMKCLFSQIYYANVPFCVSVQIGRIKILRQSDRIHNELHRFALKFTPQILEVGSYS